MNSIPQRSASKPAEDPVLLRLARGLGHDLPGSSDFDLNPDAPRAATQAAAAVLIGVIWHLGQWQVILTRRAAHLRSHAGQIALPGGRLDPGEDAAQAAVREADEETGLAPSRVTVLGTLPAHHTVTGFGVTPVFGVVSGNFDCHPSEDEVAAVFTVPLSHLVDPANYRREGRLWHGVRRDYLVVPYGPWYIWGATARILRQLAAGWHAS